MLFIWDIHINARQGDKVLKELQEFVAAFPDEKNIIFLGDYMYMFSYDRQALADLFDFFLKLREQKKNVYVMAWNHDWLNQHFIYHEGKKIADILNSHTEDSKIFFITQPEIQTIENKTILFLPYNKAFLYQKLTEYQQSIEWVFSNSLPQSDLTNEVLEKSKEMLTSKNQNEQLSGALNLFLLENCPSDTTLIHHYYTANTSFPGQFAKFDYKDIALHPAWMELPQLVISGHLHKAFVHKNYFCTGSVRHTASTERDQQKWLWRYNTTNAERTGKSIDIKPYITIQQEEKIDEEVVADAINKVYKDHYNLLQNPPEGSSIFEKKFILPEKWTNSLGSTTLIVRSTKELWEVEGLIDADIKEQIGEIQYKQTLPTHKDMSELLDISQYNLQQSLLDWKELVKKYLLSRYWTESTKYRTVLSELNIL